MNRVVVISLTLVVLTVIVPLVLYFALPDRTPPPNAPSADEERTVQQLVASSAPLVPHVTYKKVRTNDRRVAIVEAYWTGDLEQPGRKDPDAWNAAANDIARIISEDYLPSGWQVNVLLFRKRFVLMGVASRPSAEDGPEGWLRLEPQM